METTLPEFLSVPALKARGWTARLIQIFLGAPDMTRPNPHYRNAAPMRLYARHRVEQIEQSADWPHLQERATQRKRQAADAVETKRLKMLQYVEAVQITVPVIAAGVLTQRACAHYNWRQDERAERRGDWDVRPASPQSNGAFLARITVNYLRHVHSHYERELERIFGRVGVREGYLALNERVSCAIAAAYPHLAGECARQAAAKRVAKGE